MSVFGERYVVSGFSRTLSEPYVVSGFSRTMQET